MIPITCNAVGDILAVATLVLDIARALDESRGSPAKYRAFTSELKSLHIVLASVARVAELTNDALLRDEIVREVDRCGKDVRHTLERVAKFSALGRDASSDDILRIRMKRQWYKLEWRFGYHGSIESIRDELAMATQRLTAYLVVLNADGIQDLRASITDQFTTMTAQICTSLMEQFAGISSRYTGLSPPAQYPHAAVAESQLAPRQDSHLFPGVLGNAPNGLDSSKAAAAALLCIAICTMHDTSRSLHSALLLAAFGILMCSMSRDERATLPNVGYTQSNSIIFHDAMGRRLVLPIELCETPELLHATLVNLFSRMKGSWFIHAHRYAIARKGASSVTEDWNWNMTFQPGTEIEMSIVIRLSGSGDTWTVWCPVCLVRRKRTDQCKEFSCSGCGRLLRDYHGVEREEDLGSEFTRENPGSAANMDDWGRFPRARPTPTSTRPLDAPHKIPVPFKLQDPRANLPDGREPLPREANSAAPSLVVWEGQIQGFRRLRIQERWVRPYLRYSDEGPCGLTAAVENGAYALVVALLDGGADVNACDELGHTALHCACSNGYTRIAQLLLDRGAIIDAAATHDTTPLACAVDYRQHHVIALLLSRGAIVDAPRHLQVTVLFLAAQVGNIDVMRMLLRLGVDVNACIEASPHGHTPLSNAAQSGRDDVFDLLLASGAALGHVTLPLEWNGVCQSDIFYSAVTGGSHNIVATVLQHTKADVNAPFPDGTTPLSLATESGCDKVVQLLLAWGADPNAKSSPSQQMRKVYGIREGSWQALHAVAPGVHYSDSHRLAIIEALLLHGADVNAQTDLGSTPLLLALRRPSLWGGDAVVDLLLSRNAKATDEQTSRLLQEYLARIRTNTMSSPLPGAWSEDEEARSDPASTSADT